MMVPGSSGATEARQDYQRCVEISKETATGKTCVRELAKMAAQPAPASTLGERRIRKPATRHEDVHPNETRTT